MPFIYEKSMSKSICYIIILTGIAALEIGEKLDDHGMVENVAPNLILACILTGR